MCVKSWYNKNKGEYSGLVKLRFAKKLKDCQSEICLIETNRDGNMFVDVNKKNLVRIWKIHNKVVYLHQNIADFDCHLSCIRFSSNSEYIGMGSSENHVALWRNYEDKETIKNSDFESIFPDNKNFDAKQKIIDLKNILLKNSIIAENTRNVNEDEYDLITD